MKEVCRKKVRFWIGIGKHKSDHRIRNH